MLLLGRKALIIVYLQTRRVRTYWLWVLVPKGTGALEMLASFQAKIVGTLSLKDSLGVHIWASDFHLRQEP